MITLNRHAKSGFSIMEIMIAIAILGIIMVTVAPQFFKYIDDARKSRAKSDIRNIQQGIDLYNAHTGQYPETLRDLVKKPEEEGIARKWEGPYLGGKDVPKDPWGNKYQYELTQGQENPYTLYSYGKGGKSNAKSEWIDVWDEK